MVEIKSGSKLVSVEPNVKPKLKQKLQGCNVKALKSENLELKNKIVSLKNDFQKIIDEVRTLQLYVSDYDKKTKVKFSKIKMIVNILKKERELLHVQNKKFSDELKILGEENESLRRLLGEVQMAKETKNEFFKKEEKKNENPKQSKLEEKKIKHEEKIKAKNIKPLGKESWEDINVLENADSNEKQTYDHKLLQANMVMKTESLQRKKKQKNGRKTYSAMNIIKCKKILKKKEIKNNTNMSIFKNKRFSLTPFSEYLNKCKILESFLYWNNLKKKGNSENLENYLNKNSFLGQTYLSPEKRSILLENKNCDFSNVSKIQLTNDNEVQEAKTIKMRGIFKTVSLSGKKQNVITIEPEEIETASININEDEETKDSKEKEEETDSKETEEETGSKETEEETDSKETEEETDSKETEEKDNALVIKKLNSKAAEWDVKNKQKEYIIYSILKICQKLRKENFQKLQNEVNEHVFENVGCKKEKEIHFSEIENLISKKNFYHFLSFCIDLFAKQIIDQDKKLNEFEMVLNNINIFSHNLLDMLNESSYMKLKKKKKHENILVAIRNILNECQLKN